MFSCEILISLFCGSEKNCSVVQKALCSLINNPQSAYITLNDYSTAKHYGSQKQQNNMKKKKMRNIFGYTVGETEKLIYHMTSLLFSG